MTIDEKALREAAEAAAGIAHPWHTSFHLRGIGINPQDATFIAAANPQVVLALLDELAALRERESATWERAHAEFCPRGRVEGVGDVCSTHLKPGDRHMFAKVVRDA